MASSSNSYERTLLYLRPDCRLKSCWPSRKNTRKSLVKTTRNLQGWSALCRCCSWSCARTAEACRAFQPHPVNSTNTTNTIELAPHRICPPQNSHLPALRHSPCCVCAHANLGTNSSGSKKTKKVAAPAQAKREAAPAKKAADPAKKAADLAKKAEGAADPATEGMSKSAIKKVQSMHSCICFPSFTRKSCDDAATACTAC